MAGPAHPPRAPEPGLAAGPALPGPQFSSFQFPLFLDGRTSRFSWSVCGFFFGRFILPFDSSLARLQGNPSFMSAHPCAFLLVCTHDLVAPFLEAPIPSRRGKYRAVSLPVGLGQDTLDQDPCSAGGDTVVINTNKNQQTGQTDTSCARAQAGPDPSLERQLVQVARSRSRSLQSGHPPRIH